MVPCEICNKDFTTLKKLSLHCRKKHPTVEILQCCFCDYFTQEDLLFKKHKDECHPMERLGCEYCEFTSRHWKRIKKHYTRTHQTSNETKKHDSTGIEQCTNLEEKEMFVDAILVKTEPNVNDANNGNCTEQTSFVCDLCKKMFKSESHLSCHQVVHIAAEFYICTLCDRDVGSAEMYDLHLLKRHFANKPFKCDLCDKSYVLKRGLTAHKRSHVKELFYKCDKCDYQTHLKYRMTYHQIYHSNLKPYKCKICGYACFHTNNLHSHKRQHTGVKPFCCNICYKRFTQHSSLKYHKKHIHLL